MKPIAQSAKIKKPWHFIEAKWLGFNTIKVKTFFHYSTTPPSVEAKGPLLNADEIRIFSFETRAERDKFKNVISFNLPEDMKMEPVAK